MKTEIVPFVFDRALKAIRKDRLAFSEVIDSLGRRHRVRIVNESGLYRLILRSNKPDAERFQDWICDEVLPEIRRTGRFAPGLEPAMDMPFLLAEPKPARKIFPDEFFKELFRLKNKPPVALRRAPWIAQVVVNLIYQRIEEGVFDTLNLLNPTVRAKSSGKRYRRFKLHQFVADGAPMEKLIIFVNRCCEAMSNYSKWSSFYAAWDQKYPIRRDLPHELRVTFADDSELLFTFMYELEATI
jgi:prophage antirepressor-like protein